MRNCIFPHNPLAHRQSTFKQVFGHSTKFKSKPKLTNKYRDMEMLGNMERVDVLQDTLRGNFDRLMRNDGPHKRII